jgi:hypothetical protein
MINDDRRTREIKSRIVMARAAFNKKGLLTNKRDLNLRNYVAKYYIWSTALNDAGTWTLQKGDHKYLDCF